MCEKNEEGLHQYYAFCKEYNVFYYPSQTNFIFLKLGIPGNEAFERLMKKDILFVLVLHLVSMMAFVLLSV